MMSRGKLYPHNQQAYNETLELFKNYNKVAIVQATGAGKGFLAAEFILNAFKGKNILIVAPTTDILMNYEKSLGIEKSDNIKTITYSGLMSLYEKKYETSDSVYKKLSSWVDFLIVDEFHRVGAPKWGDAVIDLISIIETNNIRNRRILGLTATPIRFLDNSRDMVDEIFNGVVVQGVTLEEAIIQGILPSFKYIMSMYGFKEDIKRAESYVEKIKNGSKYKNTSVLLKAEDIIKKLNMVEEENLLLKKTIQNEIKSIVGTQKWIVFCSDLEELKNINESLSIWFDKEIYDYDNKLSDNSDTTNYLKLFKVYSDTNRTKLNKENLAGFFNAKSGLNIMVCIDKLNEGIHVDGITGIIMLRRTISPIIYLQQIGRALSAGKINKPIIFDFINNYSNMKVLRTEDESFKSLGKIVNNVNSYLISNNTKEKAQDRKIIVKNTTAKVEELFMNLEGILGNDSLGSRWTPKELSILSEYYPMRGADEVHRHLPHRTIGAIDKKASDLNIVYNPKNFNVKENKGSKLEWLDWENHIILEYFVFFNEGTRTMSQCAIDLKLDYLQHRTLNQIIDQFERLTGRQKFKINSDIKPKNEGKKWDDFDLTYLQDSINDPAEISLESMALTLDRSESAIRSKLRELGYKKEKTFKEWKHSEILYLQENYKKLSTSEISDELGRTQSSVYHKISRLKALEDYKRELNSRVNNGKYTGGWTKVDIELIEQHVDYGIDKLLSVLPKKTEKELREKVSELSKYVWCCANPLNN